MIFFHRGQIGLPDGNIAKVLLIYCKACNERQISPSLRVYAETRFKKL